MEAKTENQPKRSRWAMILDRYLEKLPEPVKFYLCCLCMWGLMKSRVDE
jgi:hypothetical protein